MTFLLLAAALAAFAKDDRSYGRIDKDVIIGLGLGTTITPRGALGAIDARVRYLDTAGVFVTYEDAFGGSAQPTRALAMGIEVRPFFLSRWLTDSEIGFPWVDLIIDSFGLELGAAMLQPQAGNFADRIALQAGIGLELPILPRASGPWIGLHAGGRLSERGLALEIQTALEQSMYFTITLSWHQAVGTHAVDVGDR